MTVGVGPSTMMVSIVDPQAIVISIFDCGHVLVVLVFGLRTSMTNVFVGPLPPAIRVSEEEGDAQ